MSSEIRFAELRKQIEAAGWALDRVNGSHHIFTKAGARNLIIPVHHGKVLPAYVRQVKKTIEEGRRPGGSAV